MTVLRYVIDSTKRTLARYPGPWDIVMDTKTDVAIALCPHHDKPVCQGAFSMAPAIADFLNVATENGLSGISLLNFADAPRIRGETFE